VPRGGSAAMMLAVRRIHYDGPLKVEAVGLPASLTMSPFTIGGKQSTVPIVLTAKDPAATASDADWGPVTLKITAPDGVGLPPAEIQLARRLRRRPMQRCFGVLEFEGRSIRCCSTGCAVFIVGRAIQCQRYSRCCATVVLKSIRICRMDRAD
jgi:hypothetical protein